MEQYENILSRDEIDDIMEKEEISFENYNEAIKALKNDYEEAIEEGYQEAYELLKEVRDKSDIFEKKALIFKTTTMMEIVCGIVDDRTKQEIRKVTKILFNLAENLENQKESAPRTGCPVFKNYGKKEGNFDD